MQFCTTEFGIAWAQAAVERSGTTRHSEISASKPSSFRIERATLAHAEGRSRQRHQVRNSCRSIAVDVGGLGNDGMCGRSDFCMGNHPSYVQWTSPNLAS